MQSCTYRQIPIIAILIVDLNFSLLCVIVLSSMALLSVLS